MVADTVQVQAFLLCDSVARDQMTGKAIITGVFDRIWCPGFPAVHQSMAAYIRLRLSGEDGATRRLQLSIRNPAGVNQNGPELPVTVPPTNVLESVIVLQGLPFESEGAYAFELALDGRILSRFELSVLRQEPPSA